METLIAQFPAQLEKALEIGRQTKLTPSAKPLQNVVIAGLGGSGIGGSIVQELVFHETQLPIQVIKSYFIPNFLDDQTLFIASSYSGNTEETLQTLELAHKRGAKIVCITSGGAMQAFAQTHGLDLILVPGGMPPRACLGYSLTQLLVTLSFHKVIPSHFVKSLEDSIALLRNNQVAIKQDAKKFAEALNGKIPVIYTTTYKEGLAVRFRQQLNENAKILCWHHVFPELNHNELVGWTQSNPDLAVIIISDESDYTRNQTRIEISREVFQKYTPTILDIKPIGETATERAIYIIHLCDWVSTYLADLRGVDAVEVNIINHLKNKLAQV